MTASVYPGALDDDTNLYRVITTDAIVPAHHNNLNDAIQAIEAAIGLIGSGGWTAGHTIASLLGGGGGSGPAELGFVVGTADYVAPGDSAWHTVTGASVAVTIGSKPIYCTAQVGACGNASGGINRIYLRIYNVTDATSVMQFGIDQPNGTQLPYTLFGRQAPAAGVKTFVLQMYATAAGFTLFHDSSQPLLTIHEA